MAESTYESKVTSAACDAHTMYGVLGNFENLERVKDLIPKDKVQEMEVSTDTIRIKVDGLGQKITIRIVDRIEDDTIKMTADNSPIPLTFWIQLKQVSPADTRIRLTLRTEIPFMFRLMVEGKLQKGLDDAADMLAKFPYQMWNVQQ
jgi:hypothetical protein